MSKRNQKRMKKNTTDRESEAEVNEYKDMMKKEAEEKVLVTFPKRILELQQMINSDKFNYTNLSLANTTINIPIPPSLESMPSESCNAILFPKGMVECNQHLVELADILKPIALQLIKDSNLVKIGILLMIPKIEDGNNFGVEIQTETLFGVAIAEMYAKKKLDQFSNYFAERAELVTKLAKYPHCGDYRRTLLENDEKFRLILCLMLVDLRDHYIKLHDMFTKNLDKIKTPRSGDNHNMMY